MRPWSRLTINFQIGNDCSLPNGTFSTSSLAPFLWGERLPLCTPAIE